MNMKTIALAGALTLCVAVGMSGCGQPRGVKGDENGPSPLTEAEIRLIEGADSVMYVLDVADSADSVILRAASRDFRDKDLQGEVFKTLAAKMLATVNAPEQGGVGIAAPQVGINRRLIVVQRLDKAGEPFEIYPNVRLDSLYGDLVKGREGCLSVPPFRGLVPRWTKATVSYKDPETLETRRDTIAGFTAVIFQHEVDHLDGVLYIDRADSVFVDEDWKRERVSFDSLGRYKKPAILRESRDF